MTDSQIQVNIISDSKDDEILTYDMNLPKDLNLLMDVPNLVKDASVKTELSKMVSKFVPKKEEVLKKKVASLLISSHPPARVPNNPFAPGFPVGGPPIGGGIFPVGGPDDISPFGGSNLIGPNSNIFKPKPSGGHHGLIGRFQIKTY